MTEKFTTADIDQARQEGRQEMLSAGLGKLINERETLQQDVTDAIGKWIDRMIEAGRIKAEKRTAAIRLMTALLHCDSGAMAYSAPGTPYFGSARRPLLRWLKELMEDMPARLG